MTNEFRHSTIFAPRLFNKSSPYLPLMLRISLLLFFCFLGQSSFAQNRGSLSGTVTDAQNAKGITGATVTADAAGLSVLTDSLGRYRIAGIPAGPYTITVTAVGFQKQSKFNVVITSGNEAELSFELTTESKELQGVTVQARGRGTARVATIETPLSVQRLTAEEIKSNPGGNFDISRVVQALPGVGSSAGTGAFRNDIIIRGGAPNENVFYLDGIEIPTINHFATQGSGGGPQGILNVSFIEDVKLSSSAFDARFDNALSSTFEFKQKTGNTQRLQGNVRLSGTELALTTDGPIGKSDKLTFLASARRSYLQVLFNLIGLPIRPNYWDFQQKITWKIDTKNTLTFIGLGAIDEFGFAPEEAKTPDQFFILNRAPVINQRTYTGGLAWRRSLGNGVLNLALSRNTLDNRLQKFDNNDESRIENLRIRNFSKETENKLRLDVSHNVNGYKITYGASAQYAQFSNNSFLRIRAAVTDSAGNVVQNGVTNTFDADLNLWRLGAFTQVSKRFFNERLGVSAGVRTDVNTFTTDGMNPAEAFSPRLSVTYSLKPGWNLNASLGRYAKIPPYTILGFQNNNQQFVNKDARYLISDHYVTGIEFLPKPTTRFTLEGFYKRYRNVPVSVRDGISLSNLGADFGVLGNEAVTTNGRGQAYGFEVFAQQKLSQRFFGVLSYTFFHSRFSGRDEVLRRSAWDNRHLVSFTGGYKWGRGWELGLRYRYQGGTPYTPYDPVQSRLNFLTLGQGIEDFSQLNTLQLRPISASDLRIDKKWNFRRATFDVYLDVTNWWAARSPARPDYSFRRTTDNSGFVTTDGRPIRPDGSNAIPVLLQDESANTLPTIGFIIEF